MSRVTKSELLKENELLKNILVQIHNLSAPFAGLNANKRSKVVETAEEITTNEPRRGTTNRNHVQLSPILLAKELKRLNANAANQRLSTSDTRDKSILLNTSGEMNKTTKPDDLLQYLRLQRNELQRPNSTASSSSASTDVSKRKSNGTAARVEPGKTAIRSENPDLTQTVTVVLDRLTPADIVNATRRPSVSSKRPSQRPEPRRTYKRKAAPTNLKELTVRDFIKKFNA